MILACVVGGIGVYLCLFRFIGQIGEGCIGQMMGIVLVVLRPPLWWPSLLGSALGQIARMLLQWRAPAGGVGACPLGSAGGRGGFPHTPRLGKLCFLFLKPFVHLLCVQVTDK